MKNRAFSVFGTFVTLTLVAVAVLYFVWNQFVNSPASGSSQEVIYEISTGKGFSSIAKELESQGVVKNADFFNAYARITGRRSQIKAGEYLLKTDMRPSQVLDILTSGKSLARSFTVSEGLSIYEVAALYERQKFGTAAEFMRLVRDRKFIQSLLGEERESLEGYLFPETYMLTKFTDARSLISSMVRRFLFIYEEVDKASQLKGWTRHQVVTLASIVEKETGAPEERPLISSVFHNRLLKGMKLQTDPTIIYGKAEKTGKIEINITRSDLSTPNRYNTYTIKGLPPGPIANPGREALMAAVKPATSNYLFFVSQNDGTHVFSQDYKGHQAAVERFQLDRKAREGKSWRDLQKRNTSK